MEVNKLPTSSKEGMELCLPMLYSCCEDRSGEVRSKAQAALPAFMKHLTFEKMLRATGKLKVRKCQQYLKMYNICKIFLFLVWIPGIYEGKGRHDQEYLKLIK